LSTLYRWRGPKSECDIFGTLNIAVQDWVTVRGGFCHSLSFSIDWEWWAALGWSDTLDMSTVCPVRPHQSKNLTSWTHRQRSQHW